MRSGLVLALVALAGCAQIAGPQFEARKQEVLATRPQCAGAEQCAAMWEAAQLWVVKNAGYKIQTITSVLIETYNPAQSSSSLAVRVVREPLGGGRYVLTASLWCANLFGCTTHPLDAALAFNRALGAGVQQPDKEK